MNQCDEVVETGLEFGVGQGFVAGIDPRALEAGCDEPATDFAAAVLCGKQPDANSATSTSQMEPSAVDQLLTEGEAWQIN